MRKRLPPTLRITVFKRDNFTCIYCKTKCIFGSEKGNGATVDHLKPRANGGTDDLENLVTACKACNRRKADYPPSFFRSHIRDGVLIKIDLN